MQSMAKIASAYYAIEALSAITTGWFSDFFIRRGYTPTLVRKSAMAIGHTIAGIALAGCALANSQWFVDPANPSVTNAIEISDMRKGTGGWVKKATGSNNVTFDGKQLDGVFVMHRRKVG